MTKLRRGSAPVAAAAAAGELNDGATLHSRRAASKTVSFASSTDHPKRQSRLVPLVIALVAVAAAFASLRLRSSARAQQEVASVSSSMEDAAVPAFLAWFQAAGGDARGVSIARFDGMGRGVVATAAIQENDVMLFVPMDLIMCRATIWKRHAAAPELLAKFAKLQDAPEELLTAFLILEQVTNASSKSTWAPYLRVLPAFSAAAMESVATPLFFPSDADVLELQDERAILAARQERQRVKLGFQRFKRLFRASLPADTALSPREYAWSRFLINSRAFSIRGERFLVPFGDIFNGKPQRSRREHANGQHFLMYHRLQPQRGMEIRADRATALHAQVFEDYGDNDNYVYSLYHGFLMADNAFDCAAMRLPALLAHSSADVWSKEKRQVLRHYGVDEQPLVCVSKRGRVLAQQDQRVVQLYQTLATMHADEMALCAQREQYASCFDHAASAPIDAAARRERDALLVRAIDAQLDAYPTTLEADELLLQQEQGKNDRSALQHALAFRISRKQILRHARDRLAQRMRKRDAQAQAAAVNVAATLEAPESDVAVAASTSMDARVARFNAWIRTLALPVNHLALQFVSPAMGYGAFATKPLRVGDVYLSVPAEHVMDLHSARRSPPVRALLRRQPKLTEKHVLLLHLLHERFDQRDASHWRTYLDLLPEPERVASPLFYADDGAELRLLRGATDLAALVDEYRTRVDRDYERLRHLLETAPAWLQAERFRWANAILDSRSIWWSGQRHLVPLLDMVNCVELADEHTPHHTRLRDDDDDDEDDEADEEADQGAETHKLGVGPVAVTHASWSFAAGEQVVENYGQPNHIYLLYHGFVLTRNSHDCAHFRFAIDARTRPSREREPLIAMMERMQLYSWTPDVCVRVKDRVGDADARASSQGNAHSLDTLARVALMEQDAQLAIQLDKLHKGTIQREHVDAALRAVAARAARLAQPTVDDDTSVSSSPSLQAVATYVAQQHALMLHLQHDLQRQQHAFVANDRGDSVEP